MISLDDYLTSGGRYPERELLAPDDVLKNATEFLDRLNPFLSFMKWRPLVINSGYRTVYVDTKLNPGGKLRLHTKGLAIDLGDPKKVWAPKITVEILVDFDLWMEDPAYTSSWVHLDIFPRQNRIFKPR